jgi:hypothetical protein
LLLRCFVVQPLRNPNIALERLFSGIHFGMDDWGKRIQPPMDTDEHGFFKPVGLASL